MESKDIFTEQDYLSVIKQIKKKLLQSHLRAIEKETAIPYMWLWQVANNKIVRPDKRRIQNLMVYFCVEFNKNDR